MKKLNPFSTRFIRPGEIEFIESHFSVAELANRIVHAKQTVQIVGPHGSGKTTLTVALAKELKTCGVDCRWLTLRQQNRFAMPTARYESYLPAVDVKSANGNLLFIDGIECLNYLQRFSMLTNLTRTNTQVVITTHRKLLGIPVLVRTTTTLELFRKLAIRLCGDESPEWNRRVENAFQSCNGDIREAFFVLYDEWESVASTV